MLSKFLKSRASVPTPTIPPGRRVYAVGDVHGCLPLLDRLLAAIDADDSSRDPAAASLVFLGDLIDRGPDSAGVVERVRQVASTRDDVRILMGNHEEVFLAALDGDTKATRLFCRIGGHETALSYGIEPEAYDRSTHEELTALLTGAVPPEHRALLSGAGDMEIVGDYAFVHAGVHPGRPLDQQRGSDLRWIREQFLGHRKPFAKMVVHGHTITDEVDFQPHRIGVDTGAYLSGTLSAVALEHDRRWVISVT